MPRQYCDTDVAMTEKRRNTRSPGGGKAGGKSMKTAKREGVGLDRHATDRTGRRYGRLVAIEPTERRQSGSIVWRCRCDCGNEVLVSAKQLRPGGAQSCGCLRRETQAAKATDHRGQRYGKLVALEPAEDRQGGGVMWRCRCDCGNELLVRGNYLVTGERTSCGKCLPREKNRAMRQIRHLVRDGVSPSEILSRLNAVSASRGVSRV